MTGRSDIVELDDGRRMLKPSVDMLAEAIRSVPNGECRELSEVLAELAAEQGADIACEATVQKHLKVVAVIAHSAVALKDPGAVPFWRVVSADSPLADRLAGGRGCVRAQRAKEKAQP